MGDGSPDDGVVTLRPFDPREAPLIIAGRDATFRRFIGEGSTVPTPDLSIVVGGSWSAGSITTATTIAGG